MQPKSKIKEIFLTSFILFVIIIPTVYAIETKENKDISTTNLEDNIAEMIDQLNQSLLYEYLEGLVNIGPRYTGTNNCREAAEYLFDEFKKIGLDVKIEPWRYLRYKCQNVVATLNGSDPDSDAVIILSAHYDTVKNTPGANDDGTGVAAILSFAEIFSKYSFKNTIKFIAFSGEEVGGLGAHAYVKKAYETGENIIAALDIDMIGYTDTSINEKFLQMIVPDRSKWIYDLSKNLSKEHSNLNLSFKILPNFPTCDHQPFIDYGFDAVLYSHENSILYPWLHKPGDTIDKINKSYFINASKLLIAISATIANKNIDVQVRIVTPLEKRVYFFDIPIVKLPGFNILDTGLRGMTYVIGRAIVRINISSNEEIDQVWFCIDGMAEGFSKGRTESWRLKRGFYPLRGKHKLGVYVISKSGKTAYDEMDIFILSLI